MYNFGYFPERLLFYKHASLIPLRWGIAGLTQKSCDFISGLLCTLREEHKIIAIAAREIADAQFSASIYRIPRIYDDYEKLALDTDIDIVFIGTINSEHFGTAMLMLRYGKHVLCESPMTMNYVQVVELINYARIKKLFLMEAVSCCCFPAYDFLRQELACRNIGDVYHMELNVSFHIHNQLPINEVNDIILNSIIECLHFLCLVYNKLPRTITINKTIEHGKIEYLKVTLNYTSNRSAIIEIEKTDSIDLLHKACIFTTNGMIIVPQFSFPTWVEILNRSGQILRTLHFPILPESNTNYHNFLGLSYLCGATEVYMCIRHGLRESQKMTHNTSLLLARLKDVICELLQIWFS